MIKLRNLTLAFGATLLISACGGGGGSGSKTVAGVDENVDDPVCFTALRSQLGARCGTDSAPSLPGTITPSSVGTGNNGAVDVLTPAGEDVTLGGPVTDAEEKFVNRVVSSSDFHMWVCGGQVEDEVVAIPLWVNADGNKFGAVAFAGDEEAVAADWGANADTVVVASAYDTVYLRDYSFATTAQWSASLESDRFDAEVNCYLFDQDGELIEGEAVVEEPTTEELLVNGSTINTLEDFWFCASSSDEQYSIAFAANGEGRWVFDEETIYDGTWEMTGPNSLSYTLESGNAVYKYDIGFSGYHEFSATLEIGDSSFEVECARYDGNGDRIR